MHSPGTVLRCSISFRLRYGLLPNSLIESNLCTRAPVGPVTTDGPTPPVAVGDASTTAGAPCLICSSRHACILPIACSKLL